MPNPVDSPDIFNLPSWSYDPLAHGAKNESTPVKQAAQSYVGMLVVFVRINILISNFARLLEPFEDALSVHGALEDNGYCMPFQKESAPTESDGT